MIPHQLIPRLAVALLLALAATLTAHASISCSAQFSDHMVLQQGRPVPIWGWAAPGANVAVAFAGQTQQARADADGRWHVTLDPLAISAENRSVTISSGSEKLVFENVLVGEVWLASGQSNMEWALKKFRDKGAAMPDLDRSLIRIMTVEQTVSNTPQDRFPFYLVQLAPHNRYGGEQLGRMWEMQLNTARNVPNTGMAVIADSAQPKNIHPDNKPHVGKRLALWALAKDYNKPVVYSGPWFKGFKAIGNRIEIEFDHADSGLAFEGENINAVRILGEGDEAYVEATPTIQGRKLIVEHPEGKKALHVRMGWTKEDVINLTNKEGLPASPFRTDRD